MPGTLDLDFIRVKRKTRSHPTSPKGSPTRSSQNRSNDNQNASESSFTKSEKSDNKKLRKRSDDGRYLFLVKSSTQSPESFDRNKFETHSTPNTPVSVSQTDLNEEPHRSKSVRAFVELLTSSDNQKIIEALSSPKKSDFSENSSKRRVSRVCVILNDAELLVESGGCQNEAAGEEGSDGSAGQSGIEASGRGRPSSLAVSPSADQLQQQQQRLSQQHQHQQRKIGVGALDGARLANNNNISVGLCVSDLSDMSSESDSEFPQPRSNGESEDLFRRAKSDSLSRSRSRVTLESWKSTQEGREVAAQTFPIDVDTLFALLFTNSEFYLDFHTSRKTLDIVQSPWQLKDDGSDDKIREVSFTLSLTNSMGYKHSQVTETQTMTRDSYPGQIYIVNVETVNSGIPYSESFYVTSNFCLSRIDDRQSSLSVVSAIKYKKAVWGLVKTFIEKNTWAGLEDFYGSLCRSLLIVSTEMSRGLKIKKIKKRSRQVNDVTQFETQKSFVDVINDAELKPITSGLTIKRGRPSVSTSTMNGVMVGDYVSSHIVRPSTSTSVSGVTSPTGSNFLVKIILLLLSSLLVANMLLFFRLYSLESRLSQPDDQSDSPMSPDPTLFFVTQGIPKTEDDWIKLVQRQEVLHQLELEKWHDLLGTATQLLRQTEESLSDLQRTIHPLALKKLRHLLFIQNFEQPPDGVDKVATHESQNENPENQSQPKTENLSKDFNNEKQEL